MCFSHSNTTKMNLLLAYRRQTALHMNDPSVCEFNSNFYRFILYLYFGLRLELA